MRVGIVGLPLVGRPPFSICSRTGTWRPLPGGRRTDAHIGAAHVPDAKLDRLAEVFKPERKTHATVEYVDLPGLARGEGKAALEGQPKEMGAYLTNLKNVETLLHIVRAFEDPAVPHSEGSVDPARDMALFELEMMFSDLAIVEKRLERLSRTSRRSGQRNSRPRTASSSGSRLRWRARSPCAS